MAPSRLHVIQFCLTDDPFDPPGHGRFGGGHQFMFDIGRYLVRDGVRVTFLTRLNHPEKTRVHELGPFCTIWRVAAGPPRDLSQAELSGHLDTLSDEAFRLLSGEHPRPDVVHSHNWISGEVARRLAGGLRVRWVHSFLSLGRTRIQLGEEPHPTDALRDAQEMAIFRTADALVAVCPAELADFRSLYPELLHLPVQLVPHGLDPDVFFPRPQPPGDYLRRAARRFEEGVADLP